MSTRTLALAALGCALIAAPQAQAAEVDTAKLQMLAQSIARPDSYVTAATLNGWIMQDRRDFVLIDVRPADQFQAAHIKSARNVPLGRLFAADELARLRVARSVVLYSNATDHAAQAAVLLRMAGVQALSLQGGFDYWAAHTLDIDKATGGDRETLDAARRDAIIRAMNNCPRLPDAKIPPLQPVSTPPQQPAGPHGPPPDRGPPQKKDDVPVIIEGGCG